MVEYILYMLARFIVLIVPLKAAYWIAGGIASLCYCFWRSAREVLKENLRNVFVRWPEREISECVRANFIQFGRFLADFFYLSKLDSSNISRFIEVENESYIEQVKVQKRGVIALGAHLGNWELGAVTLALLGHRVGAVVLGHKHAGVDAIFVGQRAKKGVQVIPVGRAGRDSYRMLLRGDMVAILGDRDVTAHGVKMPFFGKPAFFPRGMAVLAVRTGANILPGFVIRQKNGRYKFLFEKPFRANLSMNSGDSEKDVLEKWVKILEKYVVLYPEQWFMYHRVWDKN